MIMNMLLLALLCLLPSSAYANQWILDNFAGLPVTTGPTVGNTTVLFPAIVKDATCTGGNKCYIAGQAVEPSPDQRVAFVNVDVKDQVPSGIYGSGIETYGTPSEQGQNLLLNTFLSKVSIAPNWPDWAGYQATNMDGITFNGGWQYGHVYAEDLTIACPDNPTGSCWSEAALDVKPGALQAVRLTTNGGGYNTLRLWFPGPHYIVDSTINNTRWVGTSPYDVEPGNGASSGGLVWSYACIPMEIRIWNSTFNGSPTLPMNQVTCADGDNGGPLSTVITYLTVDPRTTGEMHPMFTAGVAPQPPTFQIGSRIKTITSLSVRNAASPTANVLCNKAVGKLGTIIGGPVVAVDGTWWQVNFDAGCDGWTAQATNRLQLQ